jgi:hypothetical protein
LITRAILWHSDCSGFDLEEGPLVSNIVLALEDGPAGDGSTNVQATFDISKSALVNNDAVWAGVGPDATLGTATMCTRLELMSDNSTTGVSMVFLETLMQLDVDFKTNFTTLGIVATSSERAAQDSLETDALAEGADINACHCDASGVCYTADFAPALSQGDVLNICLTLPNNTELSTVLSLTLTQRAMTTGALTDGFKFAAIASGVENVGTLVVGSEGQNIVMQVTMVSPFYLTQSVPQAVDAAGEVVLKLAGEAQARRRLVTTGAAQAETTNNVEMAPARALAQKPRTAAQEAGSSFEVEVQLSQTENESQDGSAAFGSVHSDTAMMGFVLSTIFGMAVVGAI